MKNQNKYKSEKSSENKLGNLKKSEVRDAESRRKKQGRIREPKERSWW